MRAKQRIDIWWGHGSNRHPEAWAIRPAGSDGTMFGAAKGDVEIGHLAIIRALTWAASLGFNQSQVTIHKGQQT